MARIAGIDLPKNKRSVIGLTYIYGIGQTSAHKILVETPLARPPLEDFVGGAGEVTIDTGETARGRTAILRRIV